tara:strand:+ start:3037 stop:5994 length:2958 start_codon:yes stop_codon:yes gene_type:complete
MARISTYGLDNSPSTSDKWIGTDSATGQTKNFSVESVINLINDNSFIDQFDGVIYEFTEYESSSTTQGVISVNAAGASVTQFSAVNTIYLSKKHFTGDNLDAYITAFQDGFIKINQQGNLGNFGIFQVSIIEDHDTNYKKLTVSFNAGSGQFTPNARYFVSNYQSVTDRDFSDDSVTEFGDVTIAGSGIIISDQERLNYNEIHLNGLRHSDVVNTVISSSIDTPLSANQGRILKGYIDNINTLLASDNVDLDQLQEIVDFIVTNKSTLDALGISSISGLSDALASKVDVVSGKQLSAEDFTTILKNKLDAIAESAEVNVQADWAQGVVTNDSHILNKPTDVTDLSLHDATELNDILSSGSKYIITADERTRLEDELVEKTQTITVSGTTNQLSVTPNTAQTLAASRAFTVALTDTVNIVANLNVGIDLGVTGDTSLASTKISTLTAERVLLAGTAGLVTDSTNLTFNGSLLALTGALTVSTTLGVTGASTLSTLKVSDLTDNQIVISGASGEIEGDVNLTFDGTDLNIGAGNATIGVATGDINTVGNATISGDVSVGNVLKFTGAQSTEPNVANAIYVTQEDGHDTLQFKYNGYKLTSDTLTEDITTGILVGGELSIDPGDSTKFIIQTGRGLVNQLNKTSSTVPHPEIKYVDWITQSIVVSGLNSSNTEQLNSWIYISDTGVIQQQSTPFTDAQYRNSIVIGSVIHSDGIARFARTFPVTSYGTSSQFNEFIRFFGPLKREGHVISANVSNGLSLDRSAGKTFALGRNYATNPNAPSDVIDGAKAQCVIHRYYQDGSNGFVKDDGASSQGYTTIDPTKFDNGSGTLANMPNNRFSIQRLYYFPSSPNILVVYYGRNHYSNKDVGERSIFLEDFQESSNTAEQAIHVATILVKKETTDLSVANDAHIYQAGLFRNMSATFSGGVDAGAGINDLADVNITGPTDGQGLVYNAASQQWINGAGGGGGGDIALYGMVGLEDVYYAINL